MLIRPLRRPYETDELMDKGITGQMRFRRLLLLTGCVAVARTRPIDATVIVVLHR